MSSERKHILDTVVLLYFLLVEQRAYLAISLDGHYGCHLLSIIQATGLLHLSPRRDSNSSLRSDKQKNTIEMSRQKQVTREQLSR